MLNKRLLIQNLLSNYDEGTLYDRKQEIDLTSSSGKSKLLKHICALHNSNPNNESYIVIGVSDDKVLVGSDYLDDAVFQDLVSSYLDPPPTISYENISFPSLRQDRSIGLLTILPGDGTTYFSRAIGKIGAGAIFHRIGSKSDPTDGIPRTYPENAVVVADIVKLSRTTLQTILEGTLEFKKYWSDDYNPQHLIFRDQIVLCWCGWKETHELYYSEVGIQIINDGLRLFYSANQNVDIKITESEFIVTEYVFMGYGSTFVYIPFETTTITFHDTGTYAIAKKFIFIPPQFPKEEISALYESCKKEADEAFDALYTEQEIETREEISMCFFICYLNGIPEALQDFKDSGDIVDGASAQWYAECYRILNEMEKNK